MLNPRLLVCTVTVVNIINTVTWVSDKEIVTDVNWMELATDDPDTAMY